VRRRIALGGDWERLVPLEVASYVKSTKAVARIKSLYAQQEASANNKKA
jgi:hypothetical protein